MSALDKLLKSNELNFAFLAVVPSILILVGIIHYTRSVLGSHRNIKNNNIDFKIKNTLRYILFN